MRSTFAGFNTAVRGIFAQQASLDTVGHNISNANTDGYSRQTVNLGTTRSETIYGGAGKMQLGTGVTAESVTRARDTFVDKQMWKESSTLGYGQMKEDALGRIEGIFKDNEDVGMQKILNNFWSAWKSVSTNASDYGTRTALRQRAVELVDNIKHAAQQLTDVAADLSSVIKIKVDKVNQINSEIVSLNKQIVTVEAGGRDNANDLRDRRDLLVDQLSSLIKVQVHEENDGSYAIQANGVSLVSGTSYTELAAINDTTSPLLNVYSQPVNKIVVKGTNEDITFTGGEIQGMLDARDNDIYGVKAHLDSLNEMSQFLMKDFNTIHKSGFGLDEQTGRNFFGKSSTADYNSWTPSTGEPSWISVLQVNPDLFKEPNGMDIIAAKSAADEGDASGSYAVTMAQALKSPITNPPFTLPATGFTATFGNKVSLDTFYNSMTADLGVQSQNAQQLTENQQVLVNQITNWRLSVAGVNMDEEMSNMIRFQKGYNASARMMTTMDEMLDKLINSTGVVGR